ncbi:Dehydrogenase reductase SDR member 13 [Rhizoctonia solani]
MTVPIVDLSDKLALITGANSGVGLETARTLAGMGAKVVLACRNKSKGEEAKRQIIESTGNLNVELEILDCASFASVHAFLARWKKRESRRVDILINNAGGIFSLAVVTEDVHEQTYQTNHLSHVLLTHGLLNAGCIAPNGRIISVSSIAFYTSDPLNEKNLGNHDILAKFNGKLGAKLSLSEAMQLYSRSKATQVIWSMALQRRLSATEGWKGITVHSCHPGMVRTSIWSQPTGIGEMFDVPSILFKFEVSVFGISNEEGAKTIVWLAVAPEPASPGMEGLFWDRMEWKWVRPWSLDIKLQDELWDIWCREVDMPLL